MFRKWKDFDKLHVQTKKMLIENTINILVNQGVRRIVKIVLILVVRYNNKILIHIIIIHYLTYQI